MYQFRFLFAVTNEISKGVGRPNIPSATKRFWLMWAAAIGLAFYSWSSFYHVQNIIAHSQFVEAEVIEKDVRGRGSRAQHFVHYRFEGEGGETRGVMGVNVARWFALSRGDRFDLYYYTNHPPSSLLDVTTPRKHAALIAFAALIIALLAIATQYFAARRRASPTGAL